MFSFTKIINKIMSSITINGNSYSGRNVTINNGRVIIDGKDVSPDAKEITISVVGDIDALTVDYCNKISVQGNVREAKSTSGDIDIAGSVAGNVKTTSGDVEIAGLVGGDVSSTSGDVKCGNITGKVSTVSGDIKNK